MCPTYLATGEPPGWRDHVTTLQATNEELTRNVAEEALRNFATWWMDLTFTGWFKDAGMWERMAQLKDVRLDIVPRRIDDNRGPGKTDDGQQQHNHADFQIDASCLRTLADLVRGLSRRNHDDWPASTSLLSATVA